MRLTIEESGQLTDIDGVPVRVWEGKTSGGVHCMVFVHLIAALNASDRDQFDAELEEKLQPAVDNDPLDAILEPGWRFIQ